MLCTTPNQHTPYTNSYTVFYSAYTLERGARVRRVVVFIVVAVVLVSPLRRCVRLLAWLVAGAVRAAWCVVWCVVRLVTCLLLVLVTTRVRCLACAVCARQFFYKKSKLSKLRAGASTSTYFTFSFYLILFLPPLLRPLSPSSPPLRIRRVRSVVSHTIHYTKSKQQLKLKSAPHTTSTITINKHHFYY